MEPTTSIGSNGVVLAAKAAAVAAMGFGVGAELMGSAGGPDQGTIMGKGDFVPWRA
jgi:hypothetical protein